MITYKCTLQIRIQVCSECIVSSPGPSLASHLETLSLNLLTYKEISLSIPGALLGDFVRFKGLNTRVRLWRLYDV